MFIYWINRFYSLSYQEYLYTEIHLYKIFSRSIGLHCVNSDCSTWNGEKYNPFIRYIRRISGKPWVWFDRKAQSQSFILSLTVYWSCFQEATSAKRKHESIILYIYINMYTYIYSFIHIFKQKYKHVARFARTNFHICLRQNLWKILRICNLLRYVLSFRPNPSLRRWDFGRI